MEKLSVIESALMLSLKMHPNNNSVFHARAVSATVFEIDRAIAVLKRLNYVIQDNSGRLTLNEHSIKRANTDLMHSEQKPTVHRVAEPPAVLPVMKTEVVTVKVLDKPTSESLLAQLNVQRNKGMTAGDMAKSYGGADGRSLVQILRKMKTDGLVTKFGNLWYAALKEDAVETIAVPYVDQRRNITSVDEIRALIKGNKSWFTAKEMYDYIFSMQFTLEWSLFYGVFMEMAGEGEFNVKERDAQGKFELVSYEHSYDADNQHANCRWDFTAEEFNKIVQDYIYLMQQGGTHRWNLNHCVEVTKIRSDLLLHWFELAGFDIDNILSIGKKEVSKEFLPVDRLNAEAVQEFIGDEGCRVTALVKFFNLDPAVTTKIGNVLADVGLACYDAENNFLILPNATTRFVASPRVTSNPETGIDTIQIEQIPNEGFVFLHVEVDSLRPVATQYQYGNSVFNGMPITPTNDPEIYNLQVPEDFKDEPVNPEGMYEHVRHESLNIIPSSEQRQAAFTVAALAEQRQGDTIGEDVDYEAKFAEVTKRDGSPLHSKTMSPEAKVFVDEILAQVEKHIPAAGPTGPVGPPNTSNAYIVKEPEHSSMLQIDRPLVGMHLFRVSEHALAEMKPLPETVEDESSPYFGCKITPCDGDKIGYATITIEPGHPMWQPPQYTPRYAYTSDMDKAVYGEEIVPENVDMGMDLDPDDEDVFGNTSDPLSDDDQTEAEEYASALEPHLKHLLESLSGFPTKKEMFDMFKELKGNPFDGVVGVKGTACSGGAGLPQRTVKPEWTSGLAIIADQHKRSSSTYKLLMEIKEYLEK